MLLSEIWCNHKKNNSNNNIHQDILVSIVIEICYTNGFDWNKYLHDYPDLNNSSEILDEVSLYSHWINTGIQENRCAGIVNSQKPYDCFDYGSYLNNNPDLEELDDHFKLYEHWCYNGINENRLVTDIETITTSSDTIEKIHINKNVDIFEKPDINDLWLDTLQTLINDFDWRFYLEFYKTELIPAGIITKGQALSHWLMHGHEEYRLSNNSTIIKPVVEKKDQKRMEKKEEQKLVEKKEEQKLVEEISNLPEKKQTSMPIFIINLKERIDKKMEIKHQMKSLNIDNYEFFEAWDKTKNIVTSKYKEYNEGYDKGTIKQSIFESNWKSKVIKSVGAIGLIASTVELFKQIEKKGLGNVIILEDDVQMHKSWNYMLKPLHDVMDNRDLLYIGYNNHKKHINELLIGCNRSISKTIPSDRSLYAFYGTFGYICTSQFRKKIIELGIDWFIQNNATIDYGFNILNWTEDINCSVVTGEPLVYPDVFDPECINNKRENKEKFYSDRYITCDNYLEKMKETIPFVFIVPSYNNEEWIERNINSIISQNYTNWRIIYINDNSNDKTHDKFNKLIKSVSNKSIYIHNTTKYGQAFNRYRAYNMCEDDEYCVLLDGDDWLENKYVLHYLSIFIKINDLDITYGKFNWFMDNKVQRFNFPKDYDNTTISNVKYRRDSWRGMHLRVIKAQHLKFITPLDFIQENGEFIICCTDLVESFACLELCKGRHKMTDEILMIYNKDNSVNYTTSHYSDIDKELKASIQKTIRSRDPYLSNIRNDTVIIIDIEDKNYKEMVQKYKKEFLHKSDLFLVVGNEMHFYINKLNSYENIHYMS